MVCYMMAHPLADDETSFNLLQSVLVDEYSLCTLHTNEMSSMQLAPQQGWAHSGGDYTAAVDGNRGGFGETDTADYSELYTALIGSRWDCIPLLLVL